LPSRNSTISATLLAAVVGAGLDHPDVAGADHPARLDGGRVGICLLEGAHVLAPADALARLGHLHHIVGMAQLVLGLGAEMLQSLEEQLANLLLVHPAAPSRGGSLRKRRYLGPVRR
jgi:hypothetical protein